MSPDAFDVPVQVDRRGAGELFEAPPRTAFRRILSVRTGCVRTGSVRTGRVPIPRVQIPRFSLRRAHGNVSHADADHAPAREVLKPGGVGLLVAAVARRLAAVAQPHFRIVGRREVLALDHPSVKTIGNPGRRAASPIGNGVKRPIRSCVGQPARNRAKRPIRSRVRCFDLPVAQHPRSASGRQHAAELADEFRKQRVAFASAVAIRANAVRAGGFRRDDERRIRDDDVVPLVRGAPRIQGIHGIRKVRPRIAHGLQQRTAPEVDLRPREGRVESRVAERAGGNVGGRHPRAAQGGENGVVSAAGSDVEHPLACAVGSQRRERPRGSPDGHDVVRARNRAHQLAPVGGDEDVVASPSVHSSRAMKRRRRNAIRRRRTAKRRSRNRLLRRRTAERRRRNWLRRGRRFGCRPRFRRRSKDLQMPGNRRGNDLKESAPVFDDRAHAPARPSRGKGRRNFPLAQPVAEHEKPREIGEPDVVRIDGVPAFRTSDVDSRPTFRTSDAGSLPAFKADDVGGPPAFRDRPSSGQCGNALFATHGGEGLGAEQLLNRGEGVRAQVFPQSRGGVKGRGIGPIGERGGPVEGGGTDGIGIHASSVCEPSDSCARANRKPANARNGAPTTRPRQSADSAVKAGAAVSRFSLSGSAVNGLDSQRTRQWPAHAPVTKFPPRGACTAVERAYAYTSCLQSPLFYMGVPARASFLSSSADCFSRSSR